MKLVACPNCHAQYDAAALRGGTVACRCGTSFPAETHAARDLAVTRCASCGALLRGEEKVCSYCRAEIVRRPAPAGPVCPECFARNPERAQHCVACGVAFQPQPLRERAEPLPCPVCAGSSLVSRSLGGLWVDECPSCLGLWAPGDVMDRLVERVRASRGARPSTVVRSKRRSEWQSQVVYRHCPECGGTMQRRNFGGRSGVVLDWCGSHGTWLDAHEMEDVAAFVLEGGLDRPAGSGEAGSGMTADPARTAAILAAEQLLIQERERSEAGRRARTKPGFRGLADLFDQLLR